ncbi:MAG: 16S rRNA pseudouridine516 synthase [Motiliproteus sp.]|jgi:16S rRNA pseudouridine516 synthase
MRLDKFILKSTALGRAEARASIEAGSVLVNAEPVTDASIQVHENNVITLEGQRLQPRPSRYLMIHKPLDTVCSNVDEAYPSVLSAIGLDRTYDLHIAGRLDADTTGLVLVTDDGRWSYNIITPQKRCQKVYRVSLRDAITATQMIKLTQGVRLQGEASLTLPAHIAVIHPKQVLLTITEGRYHQVKRMFSAVGNRVTALHRQQIGQLHLDIALADWRYLTRDEVNAF